MMTGLAGLAMWLMMGIMLIGLVIGGIAWTWRHLHARSQSQPPPADQTPEGTLPSRYAAGEIDHAEYLDRQRNLSQHRGIAH
jgi:uncharacterized membrane protein